MKTVPQRSQYELTPTTSSKSLMNFLVLVIIFHVIQFAIVPGCVNASSTIVCPTNDLCVDSVTGKVRARNAPYVSEFTTARKLLESRMEEKDSNASLMSLPMTYVS